ncbi:MAG: DUF4783 domain-containing protein [Bacteroidota bacterium]
MVKLFTLLLLFVPFAKNSINASGPIDNAADLLKSGNIHELAKMFASTVEITLQNEENIYSATQAELVLQNFFKTNPVKTLTIVHRVNSNPNIRYAVLSLVTANATYRTSVSLKLVNGQFLLNEIRIENEKKE